MGVFPVILRVVTLGARGTLPVLLAFFALLITWTDPVSRWIGSVAAMVGSLLPRGQYWSPPLSSDGPPWFPNLSRVAQWLNDQAAPAMIVLAATAARAAVWITLRHSMPRRFETPGGLGRIRFGGAMETAAVVMWLVVPAVLWRFYWGLRYDRLAAGLQPVPVCDGAGHIGMLWLGAAVSYAGTIVILVHRRRRQSARACVRCGYSLDGLPEGHGCPECGQDQTAPMPGLRRRRAARWLRRYGVLSVGLVLLAAPYASTLVSAALPDTWVRFVARRLPAWW